MLDPFIWHYEREAVVTTYKTLKNGKLRLYWDVTLKAQSGTKYKTAFRIDFDSSKLTGRKKANLPGVPNGRMGGLLKCRQEL